MFQIGETEGDGLRLLGSVRDLSACSAEEMVTMTSMDPER